MQEEISGVKHARFSGVDMYKAMAIVNIFETGKPFGDYAACVVLNDGAGVSYGINQFTHRSGSLLAVVEKYLADGGAVGRTMLENALPLLKRTEQAILQNLAVNDRFRKALRAAAVTREMREAQLHVAFERYLRPAIEACAGSGFVLSLSLAVIYDSMTHGSYERFRDHIKDIPNEKAWITEYIRIRDRWLWSVPRLRATRYRTQFFLNQIKLGKWDLELPLSVNGFRLEEHHIRNLTAYADGFLETAVGPNIEPLTTTAGQTPSLKPQLPTSTPQAQPPTVQSTNFSLAVTSPNVTEGADRDLAEPRASDTNPQAEACTLNEIEKRVDAIAAKYDQIERVTRTVTTRTDRAKSLWTTVVGTVWQTAWAVFGFIAGLPREVWFVVAVVVAVFMIFYLYRQIVLGKIREHGTPASLPAMNVEDVHKS